jgi:outer membrane protein assembly factor BamA
VINCRKLWLIGLCFLLLASLGVSAQQFQPKAIVFKSAPEHSDDELLLASGLEKGAALTVAEMKDHFARLRDSGVFESVLYEFDGENLIFKLSPASQLYPVRIANLPLTTGRELDEKLHAKQPLYHGKVPSEGGLLEGVRRALEEMLTAEGVKATVKSLSATT